MVKILGVIFFACVVSLAFAQSITDLTLIVEEVVPTGSFQNPTSMVFIGPDDILVSQQNYDVVRVRNGELETSPVLSFGGFNASGETGMLGMAVDPQFAEPGHNYIYICTVSGSAYRIRRYTWTGDQLVDPKIIYEEAGGLIHVGGVILFGPPDLPAADQKLFVVTGDKMQNGQTENYEQGLSPSGNSMVFRINKDGSTPSGADKGPFYNVANDNIHLERMYAYGIRNSFGLAFDPVSSALWDTENGQDRYDEINRVDPAFNSGWEDRMGPSDRPSSVINNNSGNYVQFGNPPVGDYSDPEFSWSLPSVPTAIIFLATDKLGSQYQNDCIVSAREGLYRFKLNTARTEFVLTGQFTDKVSDGRLPDGDDEAPIRFAEDLGAPTDLEIGPDGYLYALSFFYQTIYRIRPGDSSIIGWKEFE